MNLKVNLSKIGLSALLLASCAQPIADSTLEAALRSKFTPTEFQVLWTLGDRAHAGACGLVHLGPENDQMPDNDTLFIIVGTHAYTPRDVSPDQFLRWGREYCGSDWVAPNYISPIS